MGSDAMREILDPRICGVEGSTWSDMMRHSEKSRFQRPQVQPAKLLFVFYKSNINHIQNIMMLSNYNQAHQAPIFTDTYQPRFFGAKLSAVEPLEPLSDYPCGVTSPLSPISPVTPPVLGYSAPQTPTYPSPRQLTPKTPTFGSFFPRPDTPKMAMLDLLPPPQANTGNCPMPELSRPKTPTLQHFSRPLTPSAKAYHNIFPPQSRTTEVNNMELSCSAMAYESPEDEEMSYTESMPVLFYVSKMEEMDRDAVIHQKGYQILDKIRDCPQGTLWRAKVTADGAAAPKGAIVAIKRVSKLLRHDGEAMSQEFGVTDVVQEDVVKEAAIMKHCTVDIRASGRFMLKYIELFETPSDYCLVTEWHENALTMKEVCHSEGQISQITDGQMYGMRSECTLTILTSTGSALTVVEISEMTDQTTHHNICSDLTSLSLSILPTSWCVN